jgi:Circularly permutated YpsA SLOG family
MQQNNIHVLNVAGPRASKEPEVTEFVMATLDATLKP